MSWFRRIVKKVAPAAKVRQSRPSLLDYPKDKFHAYWEVLMHHDHTGARQQGTGVVRFYKHGGGVLSYSTFQAATDKELADKMFAHIEHQMPAYKR